MLTAMMDANENFTTLSDEDKTVLILKLCFKPSCEQTSIIKISPMCIHHMYTMGEILLLILLSTLIHT